MTNLRDLENIETTAAAIDAARNAIDEQRYERAQALAAVAQAEALAEIAEHLSALAAWVNCVGPGGK